MKAGKPVDQKEGKIYYEYYNHWMRKLSQAEEQYYGLCNFNPRKEMGMSRTLDNRIDHLYEYGGLLLVVGRVLRRLVSPMRFLMSPVLFAKLEMLLRLGYWPDLKHPESFNEKICCRKLFAPHPLSTVVTDKYAVREYIVARTGRLDLLNNLYFCGTNPEKIPFDDLPEKFVIKATHGSGWTIVVSDKNRVERDKIIEQCRVWLGEKYSEASKNYSEKHYDLIEPRIIVEKFIEDPTFNLPLDYKFFCFHGKVFCTRVVIRSMDLVHFKEIHYDANWEEMNFRWEAPRAQSFPRPKLLQEMIVVSEQISREFDFCRVDLYCPDDKKVIFGEVTLTPESGLSPFIPREWDYRFGEKWQWSPASRGQELTTFGTPEADE
ncbi:MAG: hypothetical protein IPH22_06345 [Nitrosomonas sp.]|nr:hypothetical protein [Nitrosomonas sp.]